jgi:hypothetical protein
VLTERYKKRSAYRATFQADAVSWAWMARWNKNACTSSAPMSGVTFVVNVEKAV